MCEKSGIFNSNSVPTYCTGAYLGGGHWAMALPFESPGLQNCIEKWAKLRHAPPFASWASGFGLEISWFWVKTFFFALHLILGEKWDEIWVKTFFFVFAIHLILAKHGTKFEHDNFKFWSMFLSNFLPPPLFKILRTLLVLYLYHYIKRRTVPTYRTCTILKKAYRTSVPYFLAKIEAYRAVPYCHPCIHQAVLP